MPLFTRYALAATHEALTHAGLPLIPATDADSVATGVSIGSGIGSLHDAYTTSLAYASRGHHGTPPLFVPRLLINLAAGHVAMRHALRGPNLAPTTACTTGAHAISSAYLHLSHPKAATHTFVAGASEACIHPLALSGFSRARSLSTAFNDQPSAASRPFDAQRNGFVIAEGACVLVLEELDHAQRRGASILAEMVGFGESCDAHHITAPPVDGRGAMQAMRAAIQMAGLRPQDVGYINAHATGTLVGDAAENRAVRSVFLDDDSNAHARAADLCFSSTKGATGHLLGASGAIEAAFAVEAVRTGQIPPTINLDRAGTESSGDSEGANAGSDQDQWDFNYVPKVSQLHPSLKLALTNSFGFGGTNASLAFKRFEG